MYRKKVDESQLFLLSIVKVGIDNQVELSIPGVGKGSCPPRSYGAPALLLFLVAALPLFHSKKWNIFCQGLRHYPTCAQRKYTLWTTRYL